MEPVILARGCAIVKLHPAWEDWHLGNVVPPAPPEPELISSHPVELQDDIGNSYGVMGSDSGAGDPFAMAGAFQVVQLTQGGKLSSIKLWLKPKTPRPTCDFIVNVYAAAGNAGVMVPTGPILATSDPIHAAALNDAGQLHEFIFSDANQIALQAGFYAFVFTFLGTYPVSGEYCYCGMHWVQTLPVNCGYVQGGWNPDDYGTLTYYLYAIP